MPIPTIPRAVASFVLSASIGAAAVVMIPLHAATVIQQQAALPAAMPATATDPRILLLQSQVASLQAQVSALSAAVVVTSTGVVLQGPTVSLVAGAITLHSSGDVLVRSDSNVNVQAGMNMSLKASSNSSLRSGGEMDVGASSTLDLRGSTLRLNAGAKPVAVLGSSVINGQIQSGSATVYAP